MAASNDIKAKPAEVRPSPFKRAVVGCMRAIAGEPDLEVTFAADRPMLSGNKARLPEPPRKMTRARRRHHPRHRRFDRAPPRLP